MPDAAPATDAPARPRTKPAEVRLDELMAAAERLFLDKGVEATTVGDITSLAGVAKGTFYHYFPSKHEMLAALAGRYTQHFLASLEAAIGLCMPNDWEGRLRAWVQANVATYLRTWQLHDIVYTSHRRSIGIDPADNRDKDAILAQLGAILAGGAAAGAWPLPQPRLAALMIYSAVHGVTDDAIAAQLQDSSAFATDVADACLRMLGTQR
ncbi:TetR/AcrR family transcriptional regulator [Janthinobacterium sp. 1_2014MBL_MicDiv]|uniref:TetR/AcrR family transcriptional regulator n=2 Tax=unclassified Janthinobacterium TaxID=2610881 RepID=UPI0008F4E2D2|nr:TetR/AcrR family transcriptional regulator [Janthinobacterium sp. 1_2014MBL_MicDiv]APA68971.1 TetR family transcriptional regulator [Janthinobacterium sp. 1_2014MBL_MicDiv]MDN2710843.1 helix-turn-helix domain containing protein [Janthinobacterium sp. SUN118]